MFVFPSAEIISLWGVFQIALSVLFLMPMYIAFVYALKNCICGISADMFGIVRVKTRLGLPCPKSVNTIFIGLIKAMKKGFDEFSPFKPVQSQRLF